VLEVQLSLDLLDRRTQGAVLTEHGRMVTQWARLVVDAVDVLVTGGRALADTSGQQLTVAASQTIAEYLVPRWLSEYRLTEGRPSVRLKVANSHGVIAAVRSREVDLGFIETPNLPTDLRCRRVGADRLVLVVAPDHPLARRRRPVTAEELSSMPLASREGGSGTRDTLRRALGQAMAEPVIELDSNAAIKVTVRSGGYAAVISELAVASELSAGMLVEVPLRDIELTRGLYAVWRKGIQLRAAAGDFVAVADKRR
jgi:DNA-binding transcriptional LysR family regulator